MDIDKYKLKVTCQTIELEGELDRELRTYILAEYEIYEVATQDNQDGTFNMVYKSKLVGSSEVKQGDKTVKGKSKRSVSQKARILLGDKDYEQIMSVIIDHPEEAVRLLKELI